MSRDFVEKLVTALLIAGVVGLANLALKVERLSARMDYFHGEAGK